MLSVGAMRNNNNRKVVGERPERATPICLSGSYSEFGGEINNNILGKLLNDRE
jgi:hypothetical protein